MSGRIKESERQRMLMNYIKEGVVPDGFYAITMKDGRIQFRRVKVKLTEEEDTLKKIEMHERKLVELKNKLTQLQQAQADKPDVSAVE